MNAIVMMVQKHLEYMSEVRELATTARDAGLGYQKTKISWSQMTGRHQEVLFGEKGERTAVLTPLGSSASVNLHMESRDQMGCWDFRGYSLQDLFKSA